MKMRFGRILRGLAIGSLYLAAGLLSGCTHPELSRRYDDANWSRAPVKYIDVSLFTMPVPDDSKTLLSQLSANGQAALIYELGKRKQGLTDFFTALGTTDDSRKGSKDGTVFKKRVVFSVSKNIGKWGENTNVGPADRISELKVTLTLPSDLDEENKPVKQGAVFSSWNKFETAYETADLAKISRVQSTEAALEMSFSPGVPVSSITPSVSAKEALTEEATLKRRYIKLSGTISPDKKSAVLYQEGDRGIDLTGTFLVDFKIRVYNPGSKHPELRQPLTLVEFDNLTKMGKIVAPSQVKVDLNYMLLPTSAKPVKCTLKYDYTLRHVNKKERETAEGYHDVEFLKGGSEVKDVTLVSQGDLQTAFFSIAKRHSEEELQLKDQSGAVVGTLLFDDFRKAREFYHWLKKTRSKTVGNYELHFKGGRLTPRDLDDIFINPTWKPD